MSWEDRISEAAVTPPSGQRITFDFENVSRERDKRGRAFNFVDAPGTYIQDKQITGFRYPVRAFFWGDDHDLEATAYENAISEKGILLLEHPFYGQNNVTVLGKIARRDDLKTAANQSIVECIFFDTTGLIYPSGDSDPSSAVLSAVDEFNTGIAEEFQENIDLDTAIERATLTNNYESLLNSAKSGLENIAKVQADVESEFNDIVDSINNGIDILVRDPLTLAFQTSIMIQSPARALAAIDARLDAYKNLAQSITQTENGDTSIITPSINDSRNANEFRLNDLYASTAVTGSIVSCVNTSSSGSAPGTIGESGSQFLTREQALLSAEEILVQLEEVTNWRDENFKSLGELDTGQSYQKLQEASAIAAGFLVQISFTLNQERSIIIDRDRTIIDLVGELYGDDIDSRLDFFINSNDLSGSEIIELKRGREIVYYV